MKEMLRKAWNDPVLSKVIGSVIFGLLVWILGSVTSAGSTLLRMHVPLWLAVVLVTASFVAATLALSRRLGSTYNFTPELKLISRRIPDPDPNKVFDYPLKCYFQLRSDSRGVVDVSVSDYKPDAVTLSGGLAMSVFQIQLNQKWLPADHGVNRVAVLPGQLTQGWIGLDEKKFTSSQARDLLGRLGTLILNVNGQLVEYKL